MDENKGRGDKNTIRLYFLPYVLNICRKFAFLISQGSVATCLNVVYEFCSKFHALSDSAKIFENWLTVDKVTESVKVKTFLRHSV